MPPPLSTQPGSRAGLVSALVIAIILLLISVLLNFYANSQLTDVTRRLDQQTKKYSAIVPSDASETSPAYALLHSGQRGVSTWLETSVNQTRKLNKLITGSTDAGPANVDEIQKQMDGLLVDTEKQLKDNQVAVNLKEIPLKGAIKVLSDALIAQHTELTKAISSRDTAMAQQREAVAQQEKELNDRQAAVLLANQKAAQAELEKNAAKDSATAAINEAALREKKTVEDANNTVTLKDVQIAQGKQNLLKSEQERDKLRAQLEKWRMGMNDPVLRQADARIVRIGTANDVFIDLGSGDHVPPGLTFEVYDKNDGVPRLGDGVSPDKLPEGKASLEVTYVGENTCRCRIIKTTPGQTLLEGDICVNLIYDRHTKLKFFVYGDYDMTGDGVYSSEGANTVKNLVVRWGGTIQNKMSIDTDFVIMGKEPELLQLNKDQEADPIQHKRSEDAKEALENYTKMLAEAATLNIPIMNQTRFLYYTGYFDLVKR